MKKIAIFYHVYQIGDWERIYTEQIIRLQQSGLFDTADYIFVGVNGDQPMPFNLAKINKIHKNTNKDQSTEYVTIKALYDYCSLQDCYAMFFHSKGVTWTDKNKIEHEKKFISNIEPVLENIPKWRDYLEYFVIDKWKDCIQLLDEHDTVGTEWTVGATLGSDYYDIPHYAGTMWWANSDYIKKLDPNFVTNNMIIGRYATELWIGTKNPKYYNFHNSGKNLYMSPPDLNYRS
jgi:hypothetical protein